MPASGTFQEFPMKRRPNPPQGGLKIPPAPETRREDLVERLHGVDVADPYRWLENAGDPEVMKWADAQNGRTRKILDTLPGREKFRARIRELLSLTLTGTPTPRKGRYFYTLRRPEQNQPEIRVRQGLDGKDEILLDVNSLSADGTTSLDWMYPSKGGAYVAVGLSEKGSEMSVLKVIDAATKRELPDVIPDTQHCALTWLPDDSGFFYTRHPHKGEVPPGDELYNAKVFFHRLGTDFRSDPLVFGADRPKTDLPMVSLSPEGDVLCINVMKGSADYTDVYVRSPALEGEFKPVIENVHNITYCHAAGGKLYITTNLGAPNYRLCTASPANPGKAHWKEIIPERQSKLEGAALIGRRMFATYLENVSTRIRMFTLEGKELGEIKLPGIGSANGLRGEWDGKEAFYSFTSFHVPLVVFRYDLETGATTEFSRTAAPVDAQAFEIKQEWFTSRDGTKVPMFVGWKKGLRLDGRNPAMLTGYGGFNIPLTPYFSAVNVSWMEAGGVFAVANLRGGSEFGENWHKAGMLGNKQNVFDDFIAAAEHLSHAGYTSPSRLALVGGSNGGLLVSAALVQRPDVAAAIVCSVPVIDMLRYTRFLIARYWAGEYGDPDNPEHFRFLYEYSPYHHVKKGARYPAVFFRTAESDSRVDPMHAMKMAAAVQWATSSERPVLFWMTRKAGHGIGMPKEMMIEEVADEMAFLQHFTEDRGGRAGD